MRYKLYLFLLAVFIATNMLSQRANYWAFEPYFGLNFSHYPLKRDTIIKLNDQFTARVNQFQVTKVRATYHTFSVCDKKGELLFYSNGVYLRDKNNQLVDTSIFLNRQSDFYLINDDLGINGGNKNRNIVCTINDSLFYIFGLYKNTKTNKKCLRFCSISIVNELPIVGVRDSVLSYNGYPENISSLKLNDGNYWLILRDTFGYASIKVSSNFIGTANYYQFFEPKESNSTSQNYLSSITSNFNKDRIYAVYSNKWSPNSTNPLYLDSNEYRLYSYSFDTSTGAIFNQKLLDYEFNYKFHKDPYFIYSSPSSQSIFVCFAKEKEQPGAFSPTYGIEQLLIQSDTIKDRVIFVTSRSNPNYIPYQMQMGYDGKIYFANRLDLGIISQPDSFPITPYIEIKPNYLSTILIANAAFTGLDFDYHKLAFRLNLSNCKSPILENISDTQFYKNYVWYINETDSFSSLNLALKNIGYGKFNIRLKGINKDGFSANYTDSIRLTPPPIAKIKTTSLQGCQYVAFNFVDSSITEIAIQDTVICHWSFGDGTFINYSRGIKQIGQTIKHTYFFSGVYTVRLVVETGYCSDTFIYQNNVVIQSAPKPGFSIVSKNWCDNPVSITILANSTQNVARYYYNFGNGDTVSTTNLSINYSYIAAGTYKVHQSILGITGCITEDSVVVIVKIGLNDKDTVQTLFTTVIDSTSTRTVWKSLPYAVKYQINSKLTTDTFYIDYTANPAQKSQAYYVRGIDTCGNQSAISLVAQTIYLKATNSPYNEYALLEYTPYLTWKEGVLNYRIEYFNEATQQWLALSTAPPNLFTYHANVLPATNGILNLSPEICYRIIATEQNGNQQISTSNEACIPVYPVAFIPNAFSPNHDGINEYFKPITAGLSTYLFEIYDRWGTLVYTDTPESKGWDGSFKGAPAEAGTYVYRLSAAGYLKSPATNDARLVERKGTLILIR